MKNRKSFNIIDIVIILSLLAVIGAAVFGFVSEYLNWTGVVLLWGVITLMGVAATLFVKKKKSAE